MEKEYQKEVFYSNTLKEFFWKLDDKILSMETTIERQNKEITELNKQIATESYKRMQEGNAMIENVLKVCLGGGNIQEMGPGVLDRIKNMHHIDQIHEYVNKLIQETKEEMI